MKGTLSFQRVRQLFDQQLAVLSTHGVLNP